MQKKDKPKYEFLKNLDTGKVIRRKIDYDEWSEEYADILNDSTEDDSDGYKKYVVRTKPCPYQLDKPEVVEELQKPVSKLKFRCEVDLELLLSANVNAGHQHEIIMDVDKSKFPPNTDFSEYEYDAGDWSCGFSYSIIPNGQVSLVSNELTEDDTVENKIKQLEIEAKDSVPVDEIESGKTRLNNHKELLLQMQAYFDKHLADEVLRVMRRLFEESNLLNDRSEARESTIKNILNDEDIELRKRLAISKGRLPVKQRTDFLTRKEQFIKKCFATFKTIEKKGNKLNKNQLAKMLFDSDNPLQSLRRNLKNLDLTFEEILAKYSEQKSS